MRYRCRINHCSWLQTTESTVDGLSRKGHLKAVRNPTDFPGESRCQSPNHTLGTPPGQPPLTTDSSALTNEVWN